jgi:hypothetical protein
MWYWMGPIHSELLALHPNDPELFVQFAGRLGYWSLMSSVAAHASQYETGSASSVLWDAIRDVDDRSVESLTAAWLHPDVAQAWGDIRGLITGAIALLADREIPESFVASIDRDPVVKALLWEQDRQSPSSTDFDPERALRVDLRGYTDTFLNLSIRYDLETGVLYETPSDILSYAFFEIVEGDLLVASCEQCKTAFVPSHGSMKFCRATCRLNYQKASKSTYHTLYQRMYKRKTRGTITQEEFDLWIQDNQWRKNAKT